MSIPSLQTLYDDNVKPILNFAGSVVEVASDLADEAIVLTSAYSSYLSKEVERITNDMAEVLKKHTGHDYQTLAFILQRCFNALPAFVFAHYTTFIMRVPFYAYWLYKTVNGQPFSHETNKNIYTGFALSSGYDAAKFTMQLFLPGYARNLSLVIANAAATCFWFGQAQAEAQAQAQPQAQPQAQAQAGQPQGAAQN